MNNSIPINHNTVHIWRVPLNDFVDEAQNLSELLSPAENERANRFHFAIHQERFIIARAFLRKILHFYTGIPSETIEFSYGLHGKPIINHPIQFNVSHSNEWAVYALTNQKKVGIDIEKIKNEFKEAVAKRFFSASDYKTLLTMPEKNRARMFYYFWTRKEALKKLTGEGLFENAEFITEDQYHIENFFVDIEFEAAFAVQPPVYGIEQWLWTKDGYMKLN